MTGFEPGPLMLEATALPTVPLPRFDPYYFNISFLFFFNFSVYQRKSMINFIGFQALSSMLIRLKLCLQHPLLFLQFFSHQFLLLFRTSK